MIIHDLDRSHLPQALGKQPVAGFPVILRGPRGSTVFLEPNGPDRLQSLDTSTCHSSRFCGANSGWRRPKGVGARGLARPVRCQKTRCKQNPGHPYSCVVSCGYLRSPCPNSSPRRPPRAARQSRDQGSLPHQRSTCQSHPSRLCERDLGFDQ